MAKLKEGTRDLRALPTRLFRDPESATPKEIRELAGMCISHMEGLKALCKHNPDQSMVVVCGGNDSVILTMPHLDDEALMKRSAEFAFHWNQAVKAVVRDIRAEESRPCEVCDGEMGAESANLMVCAVCDNTRPRP